MADSETAFMSETAFTSEGNDSDADNPKLETKRLLHAFSIEKLLSMKSENTTEMCLRTTSEESMEPMGVDCAGSRQHNAHLGLTGEDDGMPPYRRCSAITSIVSADSSSVGLRPGCCSDCEDDPEGEDMDDVAAEVSTTLTDGESSDQGPQNGEFTALRSGHTERGLPQRTAVSVRCGLRSLSAADCGLCPQRTAVSVRSGPRSLSAADRGLCPQRTAVSVRSGLRSLSAAECYILSRLF